MKEAEATTPVSASHTGKMTLTHCEGFNPAYCSYYMQQSGNGLVHYRGGRTQKGHGIGSFLGGLARSIGPLIKGVGQATLQHAKREAARGGMRALGDVVLRGQSMKSALKNRAMQSGHRILSSAVDRVAGGIKRTAGDYITRPAKVRRRATRPPAKKKKRVSSSAARKRGRRPAQVGRGDIFG